MNHPKKTEKIDPAYQSYNSAIEINKDEEKKENLSKLLKILDDEYGEEISCRQKQIEHIEKQICKVRKLLHMLRYVLVMSYYNKKELEVNGSEESTSTEHNSVTDTQIRIHPAIKKLLSNTSPSPRNSTKTNNKRKISTKHNSDSSTNECLDISLEMHEVKKMKMQNMEDNDNHNHNCTETLGLIPVSEPKLDSVRNRKKTKHRIVVGNISKWVPSLENDKLTHKWMLYVRGPKESPDVSHIIDKVIFYLHPSYKPHDVIEVNKSPYHLSRRGWGEFPVRVQIYFKVALNKPVDIVHNIKLDNKCTGRQTLGNETLVDLFLYDNTFIYDRSDCGASSMTPDNAPDTISDIKYDPTLIDSIKSETTLLDLGSTSFEHNYCFGDGKVENDEEKPQKMDISSDCSENIVFLDHCYSLPSTTEQSETNISKQSIIEPQDNNLIYGLGEFYLHTNTAQNCKKASISLIKLNNLSQLSSQEVIQSPAINSGSSFLKNCNGIEINHKNIKSLTTNNISNNNNINILSIPKNRFKSVGEALPYLFKRLPMCTSLANNINYKRLYPFVSKNSNEFLGWNIGKRLNSEWNRARVIKKILLKENIFGAVNWNTKAILMYGRSHNYTPFCKYGLFNGESPEKSLLLSCFSSVDPESSKNEVVCPEEVTVNIDSDTDGLESVQKLNNQSKIDISDPKLKQQCSYVRQAALDCGIVLKSEELEDGIVFNGAERLILEAVKSLAENLVRRASNHAICRQNNNNRNTIRQEDVETAINERTEMASLIQFKNRRRDIEFFS